MNSKIVIQRATLIIVALFVIAGALIIVLDWKEMRQVIGQANWLLLALSFLFTGLSYYCLSLSLAIVFRVFDIKQDFNYLMRVGFVSNVASYLINIGGATGVSLQYVLLKRRGLATEDVLAPSLFQLYFSGLILIVLLPASLVYILFSHQLSPGAAIGISIATGILVLLLIVASIVVFSSRARAKLLRNLGRIVHFIIRRKIDNALSDFDNAMTRGVTIIRHRPRVLWILLLIAVGDWVGTIATLWFCFAALGNFLGVGTLITGFSLSITLGFISMVPGGLGIQDGSMVGIYTLLGIPVRIAFLAAILFRIVYYFVPFLISLGFYHGLLQDSSNNT
jgi:glycosyltransferase 2 family protein